MPVTVITLKNVPPSLKGELTRWMQEIATGVFIGNFNVKIREELWKMITRTRNVGEATLSYEYPNEIGYTFETFNTKRIPINFDGIPLVFYPFREKTATLERGFSKAYKYHIARKSSKKKIDYENLVFIDIETTGLCFKKDHIIEIGALKIKNGRLLTYSDLIKTNKKIPKNISILTNITNDLLEKNGKNIKVVLQEFKNFIEKRKIVGYNINFDLNFLNNNLVKNNLSIIVNPTIDLLSLVKKHYKNLPNYKLETVLHFYNIKDKTVHRALPDAKLAYKLFAKLNKKEC